MNTPTVIKYSMKTFTNTGAEFSSGEYKTKGSMRKAKERYNLKYGAHLKAEVIEHLSDGTTRRGVCAA